MNESENKEKISTLLNDDKLSDGTTSSITFNVAQPTKQIINNDDDDDDGEYEVEYEDEEEEDADDGDDRKVELKNVPTVAAAAVDVDTPINRSKENEYEDVEYDDEDEEEMVVYEGEDEDENEIDDLEADDDGTTEYDRIANKIDELLNKTKNLTNRKVIVQDEENVQVPLNNITKKENEIKESSTPIKMERAITMDDNLSSPLSPLGQLRHAQNKWNISDLNDDELLATSSKDFPDSDTEIESGLGGGADVGQHNVVMVTNLDAITEEDGELSNGNSASIRPTTIQQSRQQLQPHQTLCDVLADDDEVNEIEIALEDDGWRDYSSNYLVEENDLEDEELELAMEEDDSDRYDSAMPDNLLLNANDQIEQIDLPMTPAIPMSPIGLNPGSPQMRPISPSSMILTKVRQCVITGQLQQLETLLDATPNFFIDAILKAGWTALMYASYRGYPDIVEYCLKRGSDSNYHKEFFTSLMAVCSSMNPNEGLLLLCIDLLLEHGANVNAVDKFGCSALHYAARFGRTLLTKSLCENGAIINHVNRNGWSALHWAAAENHGYVVATLLDQNIDLTLKTRDGVTASQLASIRKNHDIAEALLEVEKSENETNTKIVSDMEIPNRSKRSIDNEMVEMENKLKSVNIDKDNDQNMLETRKEEAREIVINAIDAALARDLSRLMSNTNTNSSLESEDKMEIAGLKPGETCAELRKRLVESTEFDHDDEDIVENVLGRDDRLALIRQQSHGDSQFNILFVLILAFALFIILKFMFWLKS